MFTPTISNLPPKIKLVLLNCQAPAAGYQRPVWVGKKGGTAQGIEVLINPRLSTVGEEPPLMTLLIPTSVLSQASPVLVPVSWSAKIGCASNVALAPLLVTPSPAVPDDIAGRLPAPTPANTVCTNAVVASF